MSIFKKICNKVASIVSGPEGLRTKYQRMKAEHKANSVWLEERCEQSRLELEETLIRFEEETKKFGIYRNQLDEMSKLLNLYKTAIDEYRAGK